MDKISNKHTQFNSKLSQENCTPAIHNSSSQQFRSSHTHRTSPYLSLHLQVNCLATPNFLSSAKKNLFKAGTVFFDWMIAWLMTRKKLVEIKTKTFSIFLRLWISVEDFLTYTFKLSHRIVKPVVPWYATPNWSFVHKREDCFCCWDRDQNKTFFHFRVRTKDWTIENWNCNPTHKLDVVWWFYKREEKIRLLHCFVVEIDQNQNFFIFTLLRW